VDALDAFSDAYRELDRRVLFPWYLIDQARRLYRAEHNPDPRVREEERRGLDLRNPRRRKEIELQVVGTLALFHPYAGLCGGAAAVFLELGIREGRRHSLPWFEDLVGRVAGAISTDSGQAGNRGGPGRLEGGTRMNVRDASPSRRPSTPGEPDDRRTSAWQSTWNVAHHQRYLRDLDMARRLHSQAARKMALLDYRSTYPGGIVLASTGRASKPRPDEKSSMRRLPQAARAGRSSPVQARAAVLARARTGGRYYDPLAWLPKAVAATRASGLSAAAPKIVAAGPVDGDNIWADRNAKIVGGGR